METGERITRSCHPTENFAANPYISAAAFAYNSPLAAVKVRRPHQILPLLGLSGALRGKRGSRAFSFWLLLSGFFTAFLVGAGAASALAVVAFSRRMDVVDREGHPIHLSWRALTYWPWLIKEIVKSAWDVSKIILDPRLPISPTLVRFKPTQRTPEGLVTHANSITLTPGTISVEVAPGRIPGARADPRQGPPA